MACIVLPLLETFIVYPVRNLQPHAALRQAVLDEPPPNDRLTFDHLKLVQLEVGETIAVHVVRIFLVHKVMTPCAPDDTGCRMLPERLQASGATFTCLLQGGVPLTDDVGNLTPAMLEVFSIEALYPTDGLDEAELLHLPVLLH